MAGTVVAVYDSHFQAEHAAQALVDMGVPLADITIVAKEASGETGVAPIASAHDDTRQDVSVHGVRDVPEHDVEQPINTHDEAIARAIVGIVICSPLGSLAMALCIYFPGTEAYFTSHPLLPQFGAAVLFGIVGAVIGAATAGGIPPAVARAYHEEVQSGKALVTVLASSANAPAMQEVLRAEGGSRLGFFTRFIDTLQSIESGNVNPAEAGIPR